MPYPRNIAEIIALVPQLPLEAGTPLALAPNLDEPMLERLFGGTVIIDKTAARLCRAGLLLLTGHLDACHEVAQAIGTPDAAYWHAIMHRCEGDLSNSLYWYRRVGAHPVFPRLLEKARFIAGGDPLFVALVGAPAWDPALFLGRCREGGEACRAIAQEEWALLFAHCYRKAVEAE